MVGGRRTSQLAVAVGLTLLASTGQPPQPPGQPQDPSLSFVSIADVDPSIILEARYLSEYNFVGQRIRGYHVPKCLTTQPLHAPQSRRNQLVAAVSAHRGSSLRSVPLGAGTRAAAGTSRVSVRRRLDAQLP